MKKAFDNIVFKIFIWCGRKFYPHISTFCPDGDAGDVLAIHFSIDERTLVRSCRDLVENSLA
jgi:hypothetical protein